MMAAAAVAGALLLLGPALMKARLGVDEVVTTLLLNFIVLLAVSLMLDGADEGPHRHGLATKRGTVGQSWSWASWSSKPACTPGCCGGWYAGTGLWALLKYTVLGFDIRAVGANARAAAFAGVSVARTVVLVAMLSGAICRSGGCH
jgi:ABC-type uncharacterized transport system permease subunit